MNAATSKWVLFCALCIAVPFPWVHMFGFFAPVAFVLASLVTAIPRHGLSQNLLTHVPQFLICTLLLYGVAWAGSKLLKRVNRKYQPLLLGASCLLILSLVVLPIYGNMCIRECDGFDSLWHFL